MAKEKIIMKSVWIYITTFIMGSVVGSLITKKVLKEQYAKAAQVEIDSVKEAFEKRRAQVRERSTFLPVEDIKHTISVFGDTLKEELEKRRPNPTAGLVRSSLDGTNTNKYDLAKKNYNISGSGLMPLDHVTPETDIGEQEEPEDDEDEDTDDAGGTEEDSEDKAPTDIPPYSIPEEEFHSGAQHHDKLSLYFYMEDEVVCDENEEIVSDIDGVVGEENLLEFDDKNRLWVRNEGLGTDFEIIALHRSYVRDVLGEREDDESEKELRNHKRREFRQE